MVTTHYYLAAPQVADKFMKFLSGKKPQSCKLIVSAYDYERTPSVNELLNLVAQIRAIGADIVKISTTAADIVDASRMFQVLAHCQVIRFLPNPTWIPCDGCTARDCAMLGRLALTHRCQVPLYCIGVLASWAGPRAGRDTMHNCVKPRAIGREQQ